MWYLHRILKYCICFFTHALFQNHLLHGLALFWSHFVLVRIGRYWYEIKRDTFIQTKHRCIAIWRYGAINEWILRIYGRKTWVRFLPGTLKIFLEVPSPVTKQPSLIKETVLNTQKLLHTNFDRTGKAECFVQSFKHFLRQRGAIPLHQSQGVSAAKMRQRKQLQPRNRHLRLSRAMYLDNAKLRSAYVLIHSN